VVAVAPVGALASSYRSWSCSDRGNLHADSRLARDSAAFRRGAACAGNNNEVPALLSQRQLRDYAADPGGNGARLRDIGCGSSGAGVAGGVMRQPQSRAETFPDHEKTAITVICLVHRALAFPDQDPLMITEPRLSSNTHRILRDQRSLLDHGIELGEGRRRGRNPGDHGIPGGSEHASNLP
jgi:hypothetical protein